MNGTAIKDTSTAQSGRTDSTVVGETTSMGIG
jgi:hypothetical protein